MSKHMSWTCSSSGFRGEFEQVKLEASPWKGWGSVAARKDLDHFGDGVVSCACLKMELRVCQAGLPQAGKTTGSTVDF